VNYEMPRVLFLQLELSPNKRVTICRKLRSYICRKAIVFSIHILNYPVYILINPTVSLEFFIEIILPIALWPWGWLSL